MTSHPYVEVRYSKAWGRAVSLALVKPVFYGGGRKDTVET